MILPCEVALEKELHREAHSSSEAEPEWSAGSCGFYPIASSFLKAGYHVRQTLAGVGGSPERQVPVLTLLGPADKQ